MGVSTGSRSTTPAAIRSSGINLPFLIACLPSRGFPKGLITRPKSSSDALILNNSPVVLTWSPSLMFSAGSRRIIETESSSKLRTTPDAPFSKTTRSPITAFERPDALITPSWFSSTSPTFCIELSE